MINLSTKRVLITGGTSGIGLGIAELLSENYELVNISRSKPPPRLREVFTHSLELDLSTSEKVIKEKLCYLKGKDAPFDAFVASAGMQKIAPLVGIRESDLQTIFQVNVFANVFLLKNLVRFNLLKEGASVVFLSSISAANPDVGLAGYSMTKAALDNLVKVAASELSHKKIRVNSIRPGLIQTPMISNERAYSDDFINQEMQKYKLGPGSSDDIARLVKFLVSEESCWMTGQNITIDGGRSLS